MGLAFQECLQVKSIYLSIYLSISGTFYGLVSFDTTFLCFFKHLDSAVLFAVPPWLAMVNQTVLWRFVPNTKLVVKKFSLYHKEFYRRLYVVFLVFLESTTRSRIK